MKKKDTNEKSKTDNDMYDYFVYEKETKTWSKATKDEFEAWEGKKVKTTPS